MPFIQPKGKKYTVVSSKAFSALKRSKSKLNDKIDRRISKRMEKKIWNVSNTAVGLPTTGQMILLSGVTQETTAANDQVRVGDSIQPSYLEARLNFRRFTTTGGDIIRVIFFIWRVDDGVDPPVLADILGSGGTEHPLNHDGRQKYSILSDRVYSLGEDTSSRNRMQARFKFGRKKLPNNIVYDGSTITGTHNLYMLVLGDRSAPDDSDMDYYTRLHFTDA